MLDLAELKQDDTVYDLGSGDGRILITAAEKFGSRAVGYEINSKLVERSRAKAKKRGVAEQVRVHTTDLFTADLSDADVVTLYLLLVQNRKLVPRLKKLEPGTRIVCHYARLPGIVPEETFRFESEDDGQTHTLYLYATPLRSSSRQASRH